MASLAWLFPDRCPVCGAPGAAPCATCWAALRPAPAFPLSTDRSLDWCRALLAYEGAGRELVARLKYRNARAAVPWLADGMAALVAGVPGRPADVVTWAPTTAVRRRQRGFDQAEVLSRAVSRRLDRPCRPLLDRQPGPPQTGRTSLERRRGPRFTARPGDLGGLTVLVVDDVVTSGATLVAAASVLRQSGAGSVMAVAAGRTPLKVVTQPADS